MCTAEPFRTPLRVHLQPSPLPRCSGQLVIPSHVSVLHVEQEVTGDDTGALQSVLECDTAREALLTEERELTAKINSG